MIYQVMIQTVQLKINLSKMKILLINHIIKLLKVYKVKTIYCIKKIIKNIKLFICLLNLNLLLNHLIFEFPFLILMIFYHKFF